MAVKASIGAGENSGAGSSLPTVEWSLGCTRELLGDHQALGSCSFPKDTQKRDAVRWEPKESADGEWSGAEDFWRLWVPTWS